jgi:hypothetical protein
VPGVDVVAEASDLAFDVEIDLLVPDVDGSRGDDELRRKAFPFDAQPLELRLDAIQSGKERELKDLLSRKASERLVITVEDCASQVLADPKLDGHVETAAERISVGGGEQQDTQKPSHGRSSSFF